MYGTVRNTVYTYHLNIFYFVIVIAVAVRSKDSCGLSILSTSIVIAGVAGINRLVGTD